MNPKDLQAFDHFIGGRFTPATGGRTLDVYEPATGQVYARVAAGDAQDVEAAVGAAQAAFPAWAATSTAERSRLLLRLAELIDAGAEDLARLESIDNGKPIALARSVDIPRAAANLHFFATAILHTHSELHVMDELALNFTLRRPRGVAGLISPWNLPLYLLTWKIAPALATGNTVVAKPSELTPATATRLAELSQRAGFPPGVLNIVHGTGSEAGAALTAHPRVPTISFTGGTVTGRAVASAAAPHFKKVSLELGGKNPTLVFEDTDLSAVLPEILRSAFANQGQICLCGSRILVQRALYDELVERLVAGACALRVGDPLLNGTQQGALVSAAHRDKVIAAVERARQEGGHVQCGGRVPPLLPERCGSGYFYEPTVITGLPPRCRTNQEEIFGPVVTVLPFEDEDEALAIANGTPYGLAASVWTRDLARAHRVAARLEAGIVWVNCWMVRDLRVPFGGMKQSGVGREGGDEALRFFTEPQNVCVKR